MKDFLIGEVEYSYSEIFSMKKDVNIYNMMLRDAEIIDLKTGEIISVNDVISLYKKRSIELDEKMEHLPNEVSIKISKMIDKDIKAKKKLELEAKLANNNITSKEYKQLHELTGLFSTDIKFDSFSISNIRIGEGEPKKPKNLSMVDYGRFHSMLEYLSYDNTIKHKNGRKMNKAAAMKILEIKDEQTWNKFIRRLVEVKMIATVEVGDVTKIIVNPLYCVRNKKIDYTMWCIFKDSNLPNFLSDITKTYFELIDAEMKAENATVISEI